ncbi:non-ribosomal peptide synthase domain TIGR01720, partial [Pedobacter terrae]
PVLVDIGRKTEWSDKIRTVKEQLREIPDKGISYGALAYLNRDQETRKSIRNANAFQIIFNYLGQLDNVLKNQGTIKTADENTGQTVEPQNAGNRKLAITVLVSQGRLRIFFSYAAEMYAKKTVQTLAKTYLNALEEIVKHCVNQPKRSILPKDFHEITPVQRYWVDDEIDKKFKETERNHGSIYSAFSIRGSLNLESFEKAIAYVLKRHESLRASFQKLNNSYYMKTIQSYKLTDFYRFTTSSQLMDYSYQEEFVRFQDHVFNMQTGPLFLTRMIEINKNTFLFSIKWHHVIADRWSTRVLYRDLLTAYYSYNEAKDPDRLPLELQLSDFMFLQNSNRKANEIDDRRYWEYRYPINNMLWEKKVEEVNSKKMSIGPSERIGFSFPPIHSNWIHELSRSFNCTLFTILQATWNMYVNKTEGKEDIIIGTYTSGRELIGSEDQIGCFASTEIIRTIINPADSLTDIIEKVKNSNKETSDHKAYSLMSFIFDHLKNWPEGTPFWDTNIVYESFTEANAGGEETLLNNNNLDIKEAFSDDDIKLNTMLIDKHLNFRKTRDGIDLLMNFNNNVHTHDEIYAMINGYFDFLEKLQSTVLSDNNTYSSQNHYHGTI